jgi:membrane-associated phospholipid phosphatase
VLVVLTSGGASAQHAAPPRFVSVAQPTAEISSDVWIAAGFLGGTLALSPFDRALAHVLQDSARQENIFLQRTAAAFRFLGFPGSVIIGASVYATGLVLDNRDVASFGLHGTEAIVVSSAFVYAGKTVLGRARPYDDIDNPFNFKLGRGFGNDRYQSFPSGHTAAAFAVAAALTEESKEIWPKAHPYMVPILYTGATFVGVSRMYNNKHWASDVVAGAAVGILTGSALIRYLYSEDTWLDERLLPGKDEEADVIASQRTRGMPPVRFMWSVPAF